MLNMNLCDKFMLLRRFISFANSVVFLVVAWSNKLVVVVMKAIEEFNGETNKREVPEISKA